MLQLFFTRHGETEWNAEGRLQGRLNSNLTDKGISDAKLLGKKLESVDFDMVLASPSLRTLDTAKLIIGSRILPLKTDERIMEIDLGDWQGRTTEEIKVELPELYELYRYHPSQFQGTGENFQDVKERLEAVLQDLERTYQSGNILVVTHGVVIKVLQMLCKNNPLDMLWEPPYIEGTSLTIVKIENGRRELLLEGDISHKNSEVLLED